MRDEIREILDTKLYFDLEEEDYIKIKDYITNLQQDNEMYAQLKDEYEEEIKDLQQIEQEHKKINGELREQIKILEENNQNMQEEMARVWQAKDSLQKDYQEAVDKIEELKQENSNLKTSLDEAQEVLSEYKEENERLKHQLKVQEDLTIKNRMRKHIYKSRCEKASDKLSFIDEALENDTLNVPLCIAKINSALNILQNGSENDGN